LQHKSLNFYHTILIFFLVLFLPTVLFMQWANSPVNRAEKTVFYVSEGSALKDVAQGLAEQQALTHPILFRLYAKVMRLEKKIKSGTFVFSKTDTPNEILDKLVRGDSIKVKLQIPEGLNIYQVASKLQDTFPQYSGEYWLRLMSDESLLNMLPARDTSIKSVEGFLFPDTYFFDPNENPVHVLQTFILHFKQVVTAEMFAKARTLGLAPIEYITLASMIEKESSKLSELNEIASVFFNRLRINMRLQSDPTVIYGLWHEYNGKITKKHLRTHTQYNTYTKYGLPVGPIANPGLSSLQAALNPTHSKNLYFVASGDGTHTFSESYKTHKKAVKHYIKKMRTYAR
jgi:UPF0755 protein